MPRNTPIPSQLAPRNVLIRPRSTASIASTHDDSPPDVVERLRRMARRMLPLAA